MALARHEIAIYIHRFHNLDLLSHGWYQLKVNARWEGSEAATNFGSPNRVLQYDVPDSKSVDVGSVWQINNEDHSFLTPPFLIKYRRQDIYLSVVVSFSFNIVSLEALFTKGVVLKFELLRSSVHQMDRSEVPDFLTFSYASVQEVRVPPRALLGLHSYCPLHFDVFHSVLVELSIHVILQSGTTEIVLRKNTRNDIPLNESLYEVVASSNQGHHLDLRLVRNQWLLIDPGAEYLMSTSNEGRTDGDFREMGKRLAEEVSSFLKFKFNVASRRSPYGSFRLSFVGHSIGNIIIRAALLDAAMKPFLDNLYTYMSIAGPHLGYLYSSNNIFSSGLWLFKKLQGSAFMHQLTFTDNIVFEDCFLFKLSQEKTFQYFQNIVLISSPQDGYVPYHSARIKMCPAAEKDSKRRPGYKAMVKNCIDQIIFPAEEDRVFLRCDVNFNHSPQAGSFNNFIGRTAHIEFLDTFIYTKFIVWSFPKLFS